MKDLSTERGFIVLFRAFTEWEWYDDALTVKLFLHLILSVNWEDKKWRGKTIKRGQMITSLGNLAESSNMSVKQVRKRLKDLESTGEIETLRTNKYTLVTVVKYNIYQDKPGERANKGQSKGKQRATTKPLKQLNKRESVPTFDEFLQYALLKKPNADRSVLRMRYDAWVEAGWQKSDKKGGYVPILRWKTTLLQTLPYIKEIEKRGNVNIFGEPKLR